MKNNFLFENDHHGLAHAARGAVNITRFERSPDVGVERLRLMAELSHTTAAGVPENLPARLRAYLLRPVRNSLSRLAEGLWPITNLQQDIAGWDESLDELVYLAHFDVMSLNGGAARILGLTRALSERYRVSIIHLVGPTRSAEVIPLGRNRRLYCIPQSPAFRKRVATLTPTMGGAAESLAFAHAEEDQPLLTYWMHQCLGRARWVILNQPYLSEVLARMPHCPPLVYDVPEHNRFFIRRLAGGDLPAAIEAQARLEKTACELAVAIQVVSGPDQDELCREQGEQIRSKLRMVPNGVSLLASPLVVPSAALRLRKTCGYTRPVSVFVGTSAYQPNEAAVQCILGLARTFPERTFVIIGMRSSDIPEGAPDDGRVVFTGRVSDEIKSALFSLSDIALAPTPPDSGSSLKVPDYLAHGKVVLGTAHACRGFPMLEPYVHKGEVAELAPMLCELQRQLEAQPEAFDQEARAVRAVLAKTLDWRVIASHMMESLCP